MSLTKKEIKENLFLASGNKNLLILKNW